MKIKQKLIFLFIITILCIWISIFFVKNTLIGVDKEFDVLKNDIIPYVTVLVGVDKTAMKLSYLLIGYVNFDKVENKEKIQKCLNNINNQVEICIKNTKCTNLVKKQKSNNLIYEIVNFITIVEDILDLKKQETDKDKILNTMDQLFYPSIDKLGYQSRNYKLYCIAEFIKIKENVHHLYANNMIILLFLFSMIIILSCIILFFIIKTILYPIDNLYKDILKEENVSVDKIINTSKDELFLLTKSFKNKLDSLKESTVSIVDFDKEMAERKRAEKEREEIEQALKKSEKRFRDIAISMSDWIWETDLDMTYTYSSSNVGLILGYNKDEMIGKSVYNFMTPKEASRCKVIFNDIVKNKKSFRDLENCGLTKDNQGVHLLTSGIPIFDKDNKLLGYRGVCIDNTEKTILKRHLKYALKMESISSLAGDVAHGFNNMLNIIIGYTDMIESKLKLDDPILKDIIEIKKATKELIDITRQLLAFSRQQKTAFQLTDINKTIINMKSFLRRIVGDNIKLKFKPGKKIWKVWADLSMLDQIIANLAINARDAMKDHGTLTVETKNVVIDKQYCTNYVSFIPGKFSDGFFVLITINDNGTGMDANTISHIFDPFFTTKNISNNTGLGLSTVYGNIKQNKGFIDVFSEIGKGTTFKIYLPKYCGKIEELKLEPIQKFKAVNIALVEDNDMMRNLTEIMLRRIGHKVNPFKTSKDAIDFCNNYNNKNKIDLLLTDVIIPDMNGVKLKKIIEEENIGIKTILMSGYSKNIIAEHGILKEEINFINKPFTIKDIENEIQKVLSK